MHGAEEQRVVADEQIRPVAHGIVDRLHRRISGEDDRRDLMRQVAHDQPRMVPILRIAQRIERFQNIHDLFECSHDWIPFPCVVGSVRRTLPIGANAGGDVKRYSKVHRVFHRILDELGRLIDFAWRQFHNQFVMDLQHNAAGEPMVTQCAVRADHRDLHDVRRRPLDRRIEGPAFGGIARIAAR